ncbi:MAG TPA: hypothetical protein VGE93_01300 [Bryobacteraceae bacterium]
MNPLEQQVSQAGLGARIFSERQVGDLLGGSAARRYGMINRALKDGSLVRLKRGTYALGRRYRREPIHPFAVAQALVPGSYVSFETALAYHGWIPEAVFVTASVTPGRKTMHFDVSDFGTFDFHPLALENYRFLTGVDRAVFGQLTALVAQPLRALMDLVAHRKVHWTGLEWVTEGLRIDESMLLQLKPKDFVALRPVYKHKAMNRFLNALESSVMMKPLWDEPE